MWGNGLPEKPITQEQIEAAFERACVKSEMRGHKLLKSRVEPRFCCECLKVTWFEVATEENGIGYRFQYRYCICGGHDTIKEHLKKPRNRP